MKKTFLLFILLACSRYVSAQFKLSGKIDHYQGKEPLQINIPQVFGVYPANTTNIPVAKSGSFSIILPIKKQKFGTLTFQQNPHLLLLTANKSLTLALDEADKKIKLISGTAVPENSLIDALNIEEYPFFLQNTDAYTRLDYAALNTRVVKPFFAARDKKLALINKFAASPEDKKLIAAEFKYATYNLLYELTDVGAQNVTAIYKAMDDIIGKSNPKPDVFPAGPQYYKYAHNYVTYKEHTILIQARDKKTKLNAPLPFYGFSTDSANASISKYGLHYMDCITALKCLPAPVAEQFIYQAIARAFYDKSLPSIEAMNKLFMQKFPASVYTADIKKKIHSLKSK